MIYKVKPDSKCKYCYGTGTVSESHPYGSAYATEYLTCDCVLEQLPEEFNDNEDEVKIEELKDEVLLNS